MLEIIQAEIDSLETAEKQQLSDGSHTFEELYDHRCILYISLCNLIKDRSEFNVTKAILHGDGFSYDGMFLLVIINESLPSQPQISYHIPMKYWELAKCDAAMFAPDYDGHTSSQTLQRLIEWYGA